ncbi:MAG: non-canonical purine NTP pyrophosphatase, partial [Longimicrobiales bacterium]|nr:non-canonical purine NTP pyrophosphatase [Longimicrobiales bacterium]
MRLLVATRSSHKLQEIRKILAPADVEVLGLDDAGIPWTEQEEELEPYDTFRENAASKARYFHDRSGLPTVADDSGLAVDALGGRPGVRSKRFAPDEGLEG